MDGAIVLPKTFTLSLPINSNKEELLDLQLRYYRNNAHKKPLSVLLKRSSWLSSITSNVIYKQFRRKSKKAKKAQSERHYTIVGSHFSDPLFLALRSNLNSQFDAFPVDTTEYLNWKFKSHPTKKYKLFIQKERNVPVGYVILRTGIAPEKKIGIISEVFTTSDVCLFHLIEFVKGYFEKNECISAYVIAQHPSYLKAFQKAGFFITNRREPVALAKKRESISFLSDIKTWFFTFESQDLDFYPNTRV
jgi:hypothetical protein